MIELDSDLIRESGKDLKNLSNDYYQVINKVFSRIDGMSSQTGEWTGISAIKFISNANLDSPQYRKFASTIKDYGQYLINAADKIDVLSKEVKKK